MKFFQKIWTPNHKNHKITKITQKMSADHLRKVIATLQKHPDDIIWSSVKTLPNGEPDSCIITTLRDEYVYDPTNAPILTVLVSKKFGKTIVGQISVRAYLIGERETWMTWDTVTVPAAELFARWTTPHAVLTDLLFLLRNPPRTPLPDDVE